ncbi:hypothetical protein N9Y91_06855 [Alphaproteobacteria bacterium]|nr:hypothetical protein [Alphaproteobacteria bacterium]
MSQLISGVIQGFGAILSGDSKKTMYNRKAADARLSGRITAINLQMKGAQILSKVNSIMSTSLARSQVGGGATNITAVQTGSLKYGVRDYSTVKDNIDIQLGRAESQAQDYQYAGEIAVRDSYIQAMGAVAGGHARQSELGYPSFGAPSTSTTSYGNRTSYYSNSGYQTDPGGF